MDWVDLMLLVTLASADLLLLVYLRQSRSRRLRMDRMRHSLVLAIRRVNQSGDPRPRAVAGLLGQY
jgi:hypothetical protein